MIVWITAPLALALHDRQLAEHGDGGGLHDAGLLDAALARPQPRHAHGDPPSDLADLAARLAFGLARNHPFVDANKRIAHLCYRVFLRLNGGDLMASDEEKHAMMIGLADGTLSDAEFAVWLRLHGVMQPVGGTVQAPKTRYARSQARRRRTHPITCPSPCIACNAGIQAGAMTPMAARNPRNPRNPHSDGEKANTPDRHRNDKARWKEHDQPEVPHEDKAPRDPEKDYPDARDTVPR